MNLFDDSYKSSQEEVMDILCESENVRIEKIISTGQVSDSWYDQDENEWVSVIEGSGKLLFEDREIILNKGDSILIKAHEKHKVNFTSDPCIWLCVFYK